MARTRPVTGTATRQSIAAQPGVARNRRRPIKQRLFLVLIALAVVLLALGGWAAKGLRLAAVMAWPR
jgi:hypothetical protein